MATEQINPEMFDLNDLNHLDIYVDDLLDMWHNGDNPQVNIGTIVKESPVKKAAVSRLETVTAGQSQEIQGTKLKLADFQHEISHLRDKVDAMFGILAKPNVLNKDAMKSLFKEYEHKFDKNNSLSAKEYAEVDMLGEILNTAAEGDYDTDEESEDKDQSPAATVEEYAATATGEEQSLNVEEYEATATSEEQSLTVEEESLAVDDHTVTATDSMPVVMGSLEMDDDDLYRLDENDIVASMGHQHSSGDQDSEPPTKKRKTGEVLCTVCGANCTPNRPLNYKNFPNEEFKSKYPVGTKFNMCNICGLRLPTQKPCGLQVREEDYRRCRTIEEVKTLILTLNGRRNKRKTKKM